MFTGLVEAVGRIERLEARPAGRRLWIGAARAGADVAVGDSLAVNGCCLTVIAGQDGRLCFDAVPETLSRTTLGEWTEGARVNLERALRLDQRLGGHLVQGHVDGVSRVRDLRPEGEGRRLTIEVPQALERFVAEKGSITVDGVSLTVAATVAGGCEVALTPHTLHSTIAGEYAAGTRVHLEVDLVARYVARLLDAAEAGRNR